MSTTALGSDCTVIVPDDALNGASIVRGKTIENNEGKATEANITALVLEAIKDIKSSEDPRLMISGKGTALVLKGDHQLEHEPHITIRVFFNGKQKTLHVNVKREQGSQTYEYLNTTTAEKVKHQTTICEYPIILKKKSPKEKMRLKRKADSQQSSKEALKPKKTCAQEVLDENRSKPLNPNAPTFVPRHLLNITV